ncbi:DnaD domain protein [Bacillus sp. JCM 19041]|uniref:DnaD domain protein n=1 Tax=Bacillus sp. JCM 19041 TaxID=1460637 RepID=UPI0006D13914
MTHSFSDVFTSLTHSEMQPKLMDEDDEAFNRDQTEVIGREKVGLAFKGFDFDLMKQALSSFVVPDELLTDDIIDLINKLAFVYQVEPLTMANLIERAALGESLQANDLRETIQTWYKLESSSQAPALGLRSQPVGQRTVVKEPTNEGERVTLFYEETAPITLLEMRQDGASVAPADVKIIEELIVDYMLNPGVVNVMIDSVLFRNDMKLSRPFMLKIAGHWKRKKIKTVPEAMRLVKEDKQKQAEAATKKTNTSRRNSRQDKLPKWLVQEQSEKANQVSSNELEEPEDVQAAKQEIASLMEERKRRRAQKGES